jgi:hypothetical protein
VYDVPHGVIPKWSASAEGCVAFNAAVRDELAALKAAGAVQVVLAARWTVPSPWQPGLGDWERELAARVAEIRAAGLGVLLVADVPDYARSVPECIWRRSIDGCSGETETGAARRRIEAESLQRIAAGAKDVAVWQPALHLCQGSHCAISQGGTILYSDQHHLSVEGARMLGPSFTDALDKALGIAVSQ